MSFFLRDLIPDEDALPGPCIENKISTSYAEVIRRFHAVTNKGHQLRLPNFETGDDVNYAARFPSVASDVSENLKVVGAPSSFATMAIAGNLIAKYGRLLNYHVEKDVPDMGEQTEEPLEGNTGKVEQLAAIGVSSVFDILRQLSKRDPDLCVQALNSLLGMLQAMPADSLRKETKSSLDSMMLVLRQLREEGGPSVSNRASSCLVALAVASGQPGYIVSAVQSLLCIQRNDQSSTDSHYDIVGMPENLHKLTIRIQQKIFQHGDTGRCWATVPISEHRRLCSFDLPSLPSDSPADTPDDDARLHSAIACDGSFLYVLNHFGLSKFGTGLQETVFGKLYAHYSKIKATKNCLLTFCNSSLYLRRGLSSSVSVLDIDSLREIGEVILPSSAMQAALFSDGSSFYTAAISSLSTLSLCTLNDSFVPSPDSKSRRKFRLTDVSFHAHGAISAIPHDLPLHLPPYLHNQAADLHLGRDVAFLQSKTGKVFYAGNGSRFGLQETGSTWMELVLPEPIVQLSLGADRVIFRSGSGQAWVAGGEDRRRNGKLRRLATIHRRKAISVCCSVGAYAYVAENGKVFMGGRHGMRVHPETGLVLGLDGVSIVSLCLGKTHVAAISKQGHVYTWGMNNLHQCGRQDTVPSVSPRNDGKKTNNSCEPNEHLWVKDMPSICVQCGLCSARGATCPLGAVRGTLCTCGPGESSCLRCGICRACGELPTGQTNTPLRSVLPPAKIQLAHGNAEMKVAAVTCGNFHTVLLTADGRVFAFGSNCHGQLGCGDAKSRQQPVQVLLANDVKVAQVAAGANHSVLRTTDGAVYTFGAHKNGQLARPPEEGLWNCTSGRVPGFGPGQPAFASWIGAFGDSTLIHSHKGTLSHEDIMDAQIISSKNDLFIFPRHIGLDYVCVKRKHGSFMHHQLGPESLYTSWCMEAKYDVLWSYNAAEMRIQAFTPYVYNPDECKDYDALEELTILKTPELLTPVEGPINYSSVQLGTHLLSSLFAVTTICRCPFWVDKTYSSHSLHSENGASEGYSVVSRFEGTGGGWGYSANSVEAIQFMSSRDVRLMGLGLYGGRGEYIAKLKLYRLNGMDGDEASVEQLTESDETLFDSGPRETATLMFAQPISIKARTWHTISAKISGPSSDCGATGKSIVECEDVIFTFRNSMISNNGTDVNVGQIPELYYQIENLHDDMDLGDRPSPDDIDVAQLFSPESLESITPDLFQNLLAILEWVLRQTWDIKQCRDERLWGVERATLIGIFTLRLLIRYCLTAYSTEFNEEKMPELSGCIAEIHQTLISLYQVANETLEDVTFIHRSILSEAVRLFLSMSHAFCPSKSIILAHLDHVIRNNVSDAHTASVLGSLARKYNLLDLFLRGKHEDIYPCLSLQISRQFAPLKPEQDSLTSFPNVLRFLYEKAFSLNEDKVYGIQKICEDIVVQMSEGLAIPNISNSLIPNLQQTSSRFRRRSAHSAWDMSDGSPDAISFRVDGPDINLHGIGVFVPLEQEGKKTWHCEILSLCADGVEQWQSMVTVIVEVQQESTDSAIIPLPSPILLKANTTYAVKVWAPDSGLKTLCGEGGIGHVKLSNGTKLYFASCSLSENGTTLLRGQIPYIVYTVATKKIEDPRDEELVLKSFLLLLRLLSNSIGAHLANGTLPANTINIVSRISGHIVVFMERYPDKSIEVMSTLEQLIPMVSSLNGTMKASTLSESFDRDSEICEPRSAQIIVESPHPYKPNTIHSVVARFDSSVEFMCVQFSSSSETAQADDNLWLYLGIGTSIYHPIGRYFGNKDWPKQSLLLPGNTLWFVLETNAEVEGIGSQQMYGYHCTVTGYQEGRKTEGLRLEQELAWLSAIACRILVQLPSNPNELAHLSTAEDDTRLLLERHGALLKKGLSLSHCPTLNELINKGQPQPAQTQDIIFLREFIAASSSTTSGFLAKWLPCGPVVDPSKCQLIVPQGEIVVGVPMTLRVITKDQHERTVLCPQMNVEVIMSAGGNSSRKPSFIYMRAHLPTQETLVQNPYQPVLLNRGRYMSICAMPAYSDCSYEEIRLNSMAAQNVKEAVFLKHKKNSTFVGEWTPTIPGSFRVECKVDGFDLSHTYTVTVVGKGVEEIRPKKRAALLSRAQLANVPSLADYQGVRMRTAPSLTSTTAGIIPRGASLSYIEEIENDDGKWLRLTDETAVLYGNNSPGEQVWCLAYHNHLRRELIPLGKDNKKKEIYSAQRHEELPAMPSTSTAQNVVIDAEDVYIVEAGDAVPVFSRPSPDALISGEEVIGRSEVHSDGWVSNAEGVWIRIQGTQKYILLEGSMGPSSIHSHSFSANGNEDEEGSPPPRAVTSVFLTALRPSVADCSRAVFAAFLWHEHLVKDAMAAATYLKFHQHLHSIWSSSEHLPVGAIPPALQPIVRLWKEVCQAVHASVEQHLIMPPSVGKAMCLSPKKSDFNNTLCELCEDCFKVPITVHMRMAHVGCGCDSQGYGYNSNGKYTTGWAGDCGSGGRAGSTWYLLCPSCRNRYLKKTPAGHRQERTRRWREFRLSATASETRPEVIIKQNALFLLDLNCSLECDSKNSSTSSGWTINLFPTATPSPMNRSGILKGKIDSSLAKSSFISQSWRGGHSDPGPKGRGLISPPNAAPATSLGGSRQPNYDEGQEVLQSPSAALRTLLSHNAPSTSSMLKRPVLAFVVEHHNLKRLRSACEQSIRRAAAFSHAFRVWNWLLRLVSSEGSVSDIIFQFLTALSSYHKLTEDLPSHQNGILPHPWRLCFLAGPLAGKMVQHLHAFLYTVAVILQSSGVDSKLRSLCFKAWTIQLTAHEQELLILTCNILATVGGVLSDGTTSENWAIDSTERMNPMKDAALDEIDVRELRDITSQAKIDASSRQAMVVCLTDGSPETFWESGDEDKNRSRNLTIKVAGEGISPVLLAIFIDNVRDEGYKTTLTIFRAILADGSRKELHNQQIESNYSGWISCCIAGTSHIQVQLKGPNHALRVRQLIVQGFPPKGTPDVMRPSTSHQLFFNHTQIDAFTLFQAISAQAFGDELSDDQQGTLRERVVDLLCSRVQLQPLQNYVGTQVVHALEREVESLCGQQKRNYSYICGLLSMLVRISNGRKGTGELIASKNSILISTSQLVIFAPQVVQCQALDSIEQFLKVFTPESVDVGRFMRNMLIAVSKVISLQVRDKTAHSVTTAIVNESVRNVPIYWRTDKGISPEIGKLTTQLLGKLSNGEFSTEWAVCIRRELASNLLNIVHLSSTPESFTSQESLNRESLSSFLSSKRFWLAVSALALVKDKSWLSLTDQWNAIEAQKHEIPDTLCENHDDGRTAAQIYCTVCETSLCRECFTVMHLNKKNRTHNVQPLAQQSRYVDIDIHQGCARMRLQQLLILFHGDSLNGMVELSADPFAFANVEQATTSTTSFAAQSKQCRFCGNALETTQQALNAVCGHEDCRQFFQVACERVLQCGHYCGGIKGEETCLPCLTCHSDHNQQDGDDLCVICFTDRLGAAPAVRLDCGHLFHFLCLRTVLEKRWNGPRINFRFMRCPLCNLELSHHGLADLLKPLNDLQMDVKNKALMRLEYDGLMQCQAVTDPNSEFHNKPAEYAMDRYMYVLCSRCNKSYFGGESRCQQALNTSQYNPEDLVCGGCSDTTGTQVCGRHGVEYLEYKCRFCCSIAVYFCFGTTHFCAACHDDFQRLMCLPKNQLPHCPAGPRGMQLEDGPCPLKIEHPPAGEEFAMGCGICRNISTF